MCTLRRHKACHNNSTSITVIAISVGRTRVSRASDSPPSRAWQRWWMPLTALVFGTANAVYVPARGDRRSVAWLCGQPTLDPFFLLPCASIGRADDGGDGVRDFAGGADAPPLRLAWRGAATDQPRCGGVGWKRSRQCTASSLFPFPRCVSCCSPDFSVSSPPPFFPPFHVLPSTTNIAVDHGG